MENNLEEIKHAEAAFFDKLAKRRASKGRIPEPADIRRATRVIPRSPGEEAVDPKMSRILDGKFRSRFIDYVAHRPKGRVLDVCCGPGWLALELGRRGQIVDGYDISSEAISIARRMLEENPYRDGFGQVTYHLEDITQVDLGYETFDAIAGWSAFHHLSDLPAFMDRVYQALKPGGIVATLDDLPRGRIEKWLHRIFRLLLPAYDRTYLKKIGYCFRWITGATKEPVEFFTPMETVAAKHTDAVHDMESIWCEKFELIWSVHFGAFANAPLMALRGPDVFRYAIARFIVCLDRVFCRMGICRGFFRIMISRKR